jgi:hypothetical protein
MVGLVFGLLTDPSGGLIFGLASGLVVGLRGCRGDWLIAAPTHTDLRLRGRVRELLWRLGRALGIGLTLTLLTALRPWVNDGQTAVLTPDGLTGELLFSQLF